MSWRHICHMFLIQPHQQLCANKISPPKPFYRFHIFIRYVCFPECNGALCCAAIYHAYTIYNHTNNADSIQYLLQTPQTIFHLTHHCVFTKISPQFSLLAAIHLFARSVTKSKISISPAKKLVAATCSVSVFIHKLLHTHS